MSRSCLHLSIVFGLRAETRQPVAKLPLHTISDCVVFSYNDWILPAKLSWPMVNETGTLCGGSCNLNVKEYVYKSK